MVQWKNNERRKLPCYLPPFNLITPKKRLFQLNRPMSYYSLPFLLIFLQYSMYFVCVIMPTGPS